MPRLTLDDNTIHLWHRRIVIGMQVDEAVLSTEEKAKSECFHFAIDRLLNQATRQLQRCVLSYYTGVNPAEWQFSNNEYGRPFIAFPVLDSPLFFNISHTRSHVVMAISRQALIGVDIESHLPDDIMAIADNFFTASEQQWLQSAEDTKHLQHRFLTLWTLKEAWIKALGTGLSTPLDSFSVVPGHADKIVLSCAAEHNPHNWFFHRGQLDDDTNESTLLAIAACFDSGANPDAVKYHEFI